MLWKCRQRTFDLTRRALVMGILNVTPDSFSDGGRYDDPRCAVIHAFEMIHQGADILDVGGESTRPGAAAVSLDQELERVLPLIHAIRSQSDVPISVDTSKAEVARQAVLAGADIINDVTAFEAEPEMAQVAARHGAGVVLMHMQGSPRTMQVNPQYGDVVREVRDYLAARARWTEQAGVARECICLDPGLGFGKRLEHNLALLARLDELVALGYPVLMGPSRKSFIGQILDLPVDERVEGTAAAVAASVLAGARVVRVHDVQTMARVSKVAGAIRQAVVESSGALG